MIDIKFLFIVSFLWCNICIAQSKLDGNYEFVSRETYITKLGEKIITPAEKTVLTTPRWKGLLLIHNGIFSYTLMEEKRGSFIDWDNQYLGYESAAGNYEIKGKKIVFTQDFSLMPFDTGKPVVMQFKLIKNKLILEENIYSRVEDMREGSIKTVFIKLKK